VLDESSFAETVAVENPSGTLTDELVTALQSALEREPSTTTLLVVEGEEDLAALPAVLAVADGASVVYGQPDEGMVLVTADEPTRERVRSLLERMDGDSASILAALAE
jgi:uncharacterized protein (UPF0218 family)